MINETPDLVKQLTRIADALERLSNGGEPVAPDMRRPISEFSHFDWASIGASVVSSDNDGPTHVEYGGTLWTRRSPQNKFGAAIWFSRASGGKDADGNVKYLRLITFQEIHDADPIGKKAAELVHKAPVAPQMPPLGHTPPAAVAPVAQTAAAPDYEPSAIAQIVREIRAAMELYTRRPALTPGQAGALPGLLESVFEAGDKEAKRHAVQKAITGHLSLREIPAETAACLYHWLRPYQDAAKVWQVNAQAKAKLVQLMAEIDKANQPSII